MTLEKDIEERVRAWAKKMGFLVVKVRFVDVGYPDRLFISTYGHTIFIEFKRPGEKPDPIQNFRLKQLRERNIPAYWVDNYIEAVNILKAALEPEILSNPSNQTSVKSSVSRLISGSRAGKDLYGPGYYKDTEGEGADPTESHYSSSETDDGDMAGGD